jgi:hypothetical protein
MPVYTDKVQDGRGVAGERGWGCHGHPGQQIPMGVKMNILNGGEKKSSLHKFRITEPNRRKFNV